MGSNNSHFEIYGSYQDKTADKSMLRLLNYGRLEVPYSSVDDLGGQIVFNKGDNFTTNITLGVVEDSLKIYKGTSNYLRIFNNGSMDFGSVPRMRLDAGAADVHDDSTSNAPYRRLIADSFTTNGLGQGRLWIEGYHIDSNSQITIGSPEAAAGLSADTATTFIGNKSTWDNHVFANGLIADFGANILVPKEATGWTNQMRMMYDSNNTSHIFTHNNDSKSLILYLGYSNTVPGSRKLTIHGDVGFGGLWGAVMHLGPVGVGYGEATGRFHGTAHGVQYCDNCIGRNQIDESELTGMSRPICGQANAGTCANASTSLTGASAGVVIRDCNVACAILCTANNAGAFGYMYQNAGANNICCVCLR